LLYKIIKNDLTFNSNFLAKIEFNSINFFCCTLQLHTHEIVEVCAKILYQVELQRNTLEQMWGFSVEAELIENSDRQDELCCYVSRVEDKSVAMQNGKHPLSRTTSN